METSNPLLSRVDAFTQEGTDNMTFDGALGKAAILLFLCAISSGFAAYFCWTSPGIEMPLIIGGAIGGLVVAMCGIFKPVWCPFLGTAYALLEGLALGSISFLYEHAFNGIVLNAILLTFGVLAVMLLLFTSRAIRVTPGLRVGIFAATGAIVLVYLVNLVMRFFGHSIPFLYDSGPLGIAISVIIVAVAAFNLLLDFDAIEQGIRAKAPKYMEWYCGMALLITLVWLYLEILQLLLKLQNRRSE